MQNPINDLEKQFQVFLTIILFFPVILNSLYVGKDLTMEGNKVVSFWGIAIGISFLSYFLLETGKEKLNLKTTKRLSNLLLLNILFFGFIGVLTALIATGVVSSFWIYYRSISILTLLPTLVLAILVDNYFRID